MVPWGEGRDFKHWTNNTKEQIFHFRAAEGEIENRNSGTGGGGGGGWEGSEMAWGRLRSERELPRGTDHRDLTAQICIAQRYGFISHQTRGKVKRLFAHWTSVYWASIKEAGSGDTAVNQTGLVSVIELTRRWGDRKSPSKEICNYI